MAPRILLLVKEKPRGHTPITGIAALLFLRSGRRLPSSFPQACVPRTRRSDRSPGAAAEVPLERRHGVQSLPAMSASFLTNRKHRHYLGSTSKPRQKPLFLIRAILMHRDDCIPRDRFRTCATRHPQSSGYGDTDTARPRCGTGSGSFLSTSETIPRTKQLCNAHLSKTVGWSPDSHPDRHGVRPRGGIQDSNALRADTRGKSAP